MPTATCLFLCLAVGLCSSISKRAFEGGQQECVSILLIDLTDADQICINVANAITPLIIEEDIVSELDLLSTGVYSEFCRPSCRRNIVTAWKMCGITQGYENQVLLITSLCGHDRDMDCFEATQAVFEFIEEVEDCEIGEVCSEECRALIQESGVYGCCRDIPVAYRTAEGETLLRPAIESTFAKCFDEADEQCTGVIVNGEEFINNLVDIDQSLSPEQIVCILDNEISTNNLDGECKAAANKLVIQINSDNLLESLAEDQSALSAFCNPDCGPAIVESWMTCNAYNDIRAEAEYIVGLCGINQGVPCYAQYEEYLEVVNDIVYCNIRNCLPKFMRYSLREFC